MRTYTRTLAAAVLCLGLAGTATAGTPPEHASPSAAVDTVARGQQVVTVDGSVHQVLHPRTNQLRRLPQVTQTVSYASSAGQERHTFTGPLLTDVLAQVEPTFDPTVKNDQLHYAIQVVAADGYSTVLSYAEIDPAFGNLPSLLAITQDGQRLARPRLTAPGDEKGGRYVSDVVSISLIKLG